MAKCNNTFLNLILVFSLLLIISFTEGRLFDCEFYDYISSYNQYSDFNLLLSSSFFFKKFHIYWLPIYMVQLVLERVNLQDQNAFRSMVHNKEILVLAFFKSSVSMLTSTLLSTLTWIATPSLLVNGFALMEQWVNYVARKVHAKQWEIKVSNKENEIWCSLTSVTFYMFCYLSFQ